MPQPSFYAALILPDTNGMAPGPYLSAATDAVARADCAPGCRPGMSDDLTAVWGDTIRIEITPQEDSDYGPRILFTARATSNAPPRSTASHSSSGSSSSWSSGVLPPEPSFQALDQRVAGSPSTAASGPRPVPQHVS